MLFKDVVEENVDIVTTSGKSESVGRKGNRWTTTKQNTVATRHGEVDMRIQAEVLTVCCCDKKRTIGDKVASIVLCCHLPLFFDRIECCQTVWVSVNALPVRLGENMAEWGYNAGRFRDKRKPRCVAHLKGVKQSSFAGALDTVNGNSDRVSWFHRFALKMPRLALKKEVSGPDADRQPPV
jgi:hypothetical protein